MTKSAKFKKAHEMTRATIKAGDDYKATFAICLSIVHDEANKEISLNVESPVNAKMIRRQAVSYALTEGHTYKRTQYQVSLDYAMGNGSAVFEIAQVNEYVNGDLGNHVAINRIGEIEYNANQKTLVFTNFETGKAIMKFNATKEYTNYHMVERELHDNMGEWIKRAFNIEHIFFNLTDKNKNYYDKLERIRVAESMRAMIGA